MALTQEGFERDRRMNQRFADQINAYWERRGYKANARPVSHDFGSDQRYEVRHILVSDTANGMPKRSQRV